jgi:sulfur carrier protein ThiS
MLATLNIVTNPFNPALDRVQKPIQRKVKINTLVNRHEINLSKPVVCYHNGSPVLRKQWSSTVIKDGDIVSFVYLPQGGGGGGSNPLKMILMIGMMAFAPYLAGIVGPSMGIAAGSFGMSMLSAGIGFLGNALINALIPPPQPPKSQQMAQMSAPSPTYNIGAQGNSARIGQAIPVLYGKMKVFPDFASQPYAEYENNNQYLYQLFCVSQGRATIPPDGIFIEDSPVSSFGEDFEYEVIYPNQVSTLFPRSVFNVPEVSGQELKDSDPAGPFVLNPSLTVISKIGMDVAIPRGLAYIQDSGAFSAITVTFQFRATMIDDAGNNIGSEFVLGTESITAATSTAIRRTYKYNVTPGRYKVFATRVGGKNEDSRAYNDVVWASARGYSAQTASYGDMTLLALKLKATNAVSSQSSRKVNVIATRCLEAPSLNATSDGYNWSSRVETQSIAWAIADMCRAAYGAGVTEARFDVGQLMALDAVWTARGDKLNCIFDSTQTFWESLSMACRTGRCRPYIQGGIIHFVRDALQTLPTALFTNRNIVKGSFKITYIMPSDDTSDCIDVEYFDEVTWKPRIVRAALDAGTTNKPAKIKAFGITSREQAHKEGMYAAAGNRYRRKEISFETELEGHIPALGDLIGIQSDIPEWGQSGEVVSHSSGQLVSSEPFKWTDGAQHYMLLRKANGSALGPIEVTKGADDYTLLFNQAEIDFSIYTGMDMEKTHIVFGRTGQVIQLARVLTTVPRNSTVQITAINEDARVHSADGTPAPVDTYEWSLTTPKIKPILTDFSLSQTGNGTTPSVSVSWLQVAGASKYVIEKSYDNINWETVAEIAGNSYSFLSNVGTLYVRVAAFGGVVGPFVSKSISIGEVAPPANVISGSISSNGQSYDVSWSAVTDCDGYYVEVLNGGSVKRSFRTITTNFAYTLENAIADGGPWRAIQVKVSATKGSVPSVTPLALNGTNEAPVAPSISLVPGAQSVSVTVSNCSDLDYAGTIIYASSVNGFTPSPANKIYEGNGNFFLHTDVTGDMYYRAVHFDSYGADGLNMSAQYSATPTESSSGIEVVNALPTSGNFEGRVVYLTTDDSLYTYDVDTSQWVAAGGGVSPGSVTSIELANDAVTAAKISAGAVTANKINVANLSAIHANMGDITSGTITLDNAGHIKGGQTAYNTGNGFFLGYSDAAYKFSVGNSTAGLTWDGAAMTIKGAFTGGSIAIGTGFSVDATGNVTIKSAATGARLEIKNNVIKVYDETDTLRVKIGDLLA